MASPDSTTLSGWRHTAATITLGWVIGAHIYLVLSVFPYAGPWVMEIVPDVNSDNAGFYAGWIAGIVMITRAIASYCWGVFTDTYGRVTAMQLSLLACAITSVCLGLSSNFWWVLFFRGLSGLANCLFPNTRVSVTEISRNDEKLESASMNFVMAVCSVTNSFAPALAGVFVEPVKQYPEIDWLQSGPLSTLFSRFPFLLPNLIGSGFCLVGMVLLRMFVIETLPDDIRRPVGGMRRDLAFAARNFFTRISVRPRSFIGEGALCTESTPLRQKTPSSSSLSSSSSPSSPSGVAASANGSMAKKSIQFPGGSHENQGAIIPTNTTCDETETCTMSSLWAKSHVRSQFIVAWLMYAVAFGVDSAFPLYCISESAGLGVSERYIGQVLGVCGFLFFLTQLVGYGPIVDRLGLYGSIRLVPLIMGPLVALMPLAGLLNHGAEEGWNLSTLIFLSILLTATKVIFATFFSSMSVANNRLVPPAQLGSLNGLFMTGASMTDFCGIILGGLISATFFSELSLSSSIAPILLWGTLALLSAVVALLGFLWLKNPSE